MSTGIHCLPSATQAKLRSTQILTSLPQIVSELVQNSLDAGAKRVELGVDCEEWSCWVRDDGCGMSKNELTALIDIGRYSTSKAYTPTSLENVNTFGFRGEALASVANLCCLEISSRTQRSRECWSIISKNGESLYNGPAIRWRLESPGTVVSVRDAFYNLPVRRRSHPPAQRSLELLRKDIEAHALVFPHVSFTLENTSRASLGRTDRSRLLSIPKTASTLQAFRHLFGRALAEKVEEIHEVADRLAVDGFISLEGASSRTFQYLYLNHHLLASCELHRIIDTLFTRSYFSRHALDEYMELSQPLSATRRSPKKSEKKPVYVLDITVPPGQVDNCLEPAKAVVHLQNSSAVSALLSSIINSFLVKHGFKSDRLRKRENSDTPPPKKRKVALSHSAESSLTPTDTHASSSRMRNIQLNQNQTPIIIPEDNSGEKGEFIWTDARTGETFAVDRRTGNSYSVNERREDAAGISGGRRTLAPRPQSFDGKRLRVIVGAQLSGLEDQEKQDEAPKWIREALGANDTYILRSSQRSIPALSLSSSGAQEIDEWHRQNGHARPLRSHGKAKAVARAVGRKQLANTRSHVAQFTKTDLEHAEVLSQVDRKFVACVLRASAATEDSQWGGENQSSAGVDNHAQPTLVLIDQHAADERIRVEHILRELCSAFISPEEGDAQSSSVPVRLLVPSVRVLLTRHEAERLARSSGVRSAFELWGIRFTDDSLDLVGDVHIDDRHPRGKRLREDSGFAQVSVESVPETLAAKLLEGDTLRDLIKSYLAELAASGNAEAVSIGATHAHNADVNSTKSTATKGWQRALRWCPRELLELANSKACRGAIMFNDVLGVDRCVRLVRELAGAALPFQCAHGRPSLVPLASLGEEVNKNAVETAKSVVYSRHLQPIDWSQFAREGSVSDSRIDEMD